MGRRKRFGSPEGKGKDKSQGTYPIETRAQALASVAKVKKDGTPEEQKAVIAAVCKKYPELDMCKERNKGMNDAIRKRSGRATKESS